MEGRKENAFGVGCWLVAEYSFHIFKAWILCIPHWHVCLHMSYLEYSSFNNKCKEFPSPNKNIEYKESASLAAFDRVLKIYTKMLGFSIAHF